MNADSMGMTCDLGEILREFRVHAYHFELCVLETLVLPAENETNILRGAFGQAFRRLACTRPAGCLSRCEEPEGCPYGVVFEPVPPHDTERLRKYSDIPRPFVFRAHDDGRNEYQAGECFAFDLLLFGAAEPYLPYFILAFRDVIRTGLGRTRARCRLDPS